MIVELADFIASCIRLVSGWLLGLNTSEVLLLLIFISILVLACLAWTLLRVTAAQTVVLYELQHFLLEELMGFSASRKNQEDVLEQIESQGEHLREIIEILKKDNDYGN